MADPERTMGRLNFKEVPQFLKFNQILLAYGQQVIKTKLL